MMRFFSSLFGYRQTEACTANSLPYFLFALYGACTVIFMIPSMFFYRASAASLIVLGGLLAGCGQKGPLVLPPQTQAQTQAQIPIAQSPQPNVATQMSTQPLSN
jgi:predicted small lipoprotein YifL